MEVRKAIQGKPVFGVGIAIVMLLLAGLIIAREYWPQKKPDASRAYLTDDDGKTWYVESAYSVPPLDHDGKTAVFAEIFTYDGGSKQFCGYLQKYTPEAKKRLDASIAEAVQNGQQPGSAKLFQDHWFMQQGTLVKSVGPGDKWISVSDPAAAAVMSIHSPDGSPLDNAFVN
jgi:hypothetical protein